MKPARCHKLGKRDLKRAMKQAGKNSSWVNDVASSLHHRPRLKGTFGAASSVRHIVKNGEPQT